MALLVLVSCASTATEPEMATSSCYRRGNLSLPHCLTTDLYTTYTIPGRTRILGAGSDTTTAAGAGVWGVHSNLNCFTNTAQGYNGGSTIRPEPWSRSTPLASCQAACVADTACDAIVVTNPSPPKPPGPGPRPASANASALQSRVAAAIAAGVRSVELPGGEYDFGSTNFDIVGATDLALLAPQRLSLR